MAQCLSLSSRQRKKRAAAAERERSSSSDDGERRHEEGDQRDPRYPPLRHQRRRQGRPRAAASSPVHHPIGTNPPLLCFPCYRNPNAESRCLGHALPHRRPNSGRTRRSSGRRPSTDPPSTSARISMPKSSPGPSLPLAIPPEICCYLHQFVRASSL